MLRLATEREYRGTVHFNACDLAALMNGAFTVLSRHVTGARLAPFHDLGMFFDPRLAIWCPERVSNPHAFRGRRILSPLRLPIPPSGPRRGGRLGRAAAVSTPNSGRVFERRAPGARLSRC